MAIKSIRRKILLNRKLMRYIAREMQIQAENERREADARRRAAIIRLSVMNRMAREYPLQEPQQNRQAPPQEQNQELQNRQEQNRQEQNQEQQIIRASTANTANTARTALRAAYRIIDSHEHVLKSAIYDMYYSHPDLIDAFSEWQQEQMPIVGAEFCLKLFDFLLLYHSSEIAVMNEDQESSASMGDIFIEMVRDSMDFRPKMPTTGAYVSAIEFFTYAINVY